MDRGVTIENPYASVSLPRAQLKEGFLHYYLGEDQAPGTTLYSPSRLPTYAEAPPADAGPGPRVPTRESWARPFNPYASLSLPNGAAPEPFHWKSQQASGGGGGGDPQGDGCCCCCCCPCCRKCSPCSRRCRCVVS